MKPFYKKAFFLAKVNKEEDLDMIKEKAPEMDKAIRHLRVLSADEEAKYLEQERISGISLRKTLLGTARREGLAEGLAEGRVEGLAEGLTKGRLEGKVELLFKDLGLSVEEIAKKLSVGEDYINTLLKELSLI